MSLKNSLWQVGIALASVSCLDRASRTCIVRMSHLYHTAAQVPRQAENLLTAIRILCCELKCDFNEY